MKIKETTFLILIIFLSLASCDNDPKKPDTTAARFSTDLQLDHFNCWVEVPQQAKNRLVEIGFAAVPDSLCKIHHGQGTTGRYFYFLNTYLELIFVYDQVELEENARVNDELDFVERAGFKNNGASPFGIALKVKNYEVDKIPFAKVKYHQAWMEELSSIYAAKSSKVNLSEPSVFVVYPEIEADNFETMDDLIQIPEEYALWREFFKHPNGAQKVTSISITSPTLDNPSETMSAINGLGNVSAAAGEEHLMEITFDNGKQGKKFDLRPDLPMIVHL